MDRWKKKDFLSLNENAAKEGFLPKGLFIRIAGKMFSECQTVEGLSIDNFELNVDFFSVKFGGRSLQLRNFELGNVIEIQVSGEHMSSLIDRITNVIQTAVNEMIPRLKIGIVIPSNGISTLTYCRITPSSTTVFSACCPANSPYSLNPAFHFHLIALKIVSVIGCPSTQQTSTSHSTYVYVTRSAMHSAAALQPSCPAG